VLASDDEAEREEPIELSREGALSYLYVSNVL